MGDPPKTAGKSADARLTGDASRATGAGSGPGPSIGEVSWTALIERADRPQQRQSVGGWRSQTSGRVGNREVIIVEGTVGPKLPAHERFKAAKLEETLNGEHGIHAWGLQLGENLPEGIRSGPGRALNQSLLKRIENDLRLVADQAEEIGAVVEARATVMIEYRTEGNKVIPIIVGVRREAELRPSGPGKDPIRLVDFWATVDPVTREVNFREAPGTAGRARLTDARVVGRSTRSGKGNPRLTEARISGPERESAATTPPVEPAPGGAGPAPRSAPRAPASGGGGVKGAGALTIVLVLMEFAAIYADYLQGKAAKAALENQKQQIGGFLQSHPEYGALIVIKFKQQVANPSHEASLHAPPPRFHSVMAYYGTTYSEAYAAWRTSREVDTFDQRYFVESHDTRWIPPRVPGSAKPPSHDPQSITALVRDLRAYLKPPPSYGPAFHALNGCAMNQMLDALNELKRAGQLDQLIANFDKAEGVNRGRLWAALKATYFRDRDGAYQLFMADPTCRFAISGVEPGGRTAIQRVLLKVRGTPPG